MNLFYWTFLFSLIACPIVGQDVNIVPFLKDIEAGKVESVKSKLPELLSENPFDPDVQFLDAVLTEDGESALEKYKSIVRKYPRSKFADASLYRIFSFYFAVGLYKQAGENLQKLKSDYPNSPYIKIAERRNLNYQNPAVKKNKAPLKTNSSSSQQFSIQVGAFMNLNNARNLMKSFKEAGFSAEITPKTVGGSILNVVRVGAYKSKSEAEKARDEIFANFKIKGRIIERN